MRIQNTARERKPTRRLYDDEIMSGVYEPPGVEFSTEKGVARVREEVGHALIEKYEFLEAVESEFETDDETDDEPTPVIESVDDGETTDSDEETN